MSSELAPGLATERTVRVDAGRVVALDATLSVYATPSMVRDIEQTCRDLLAPLLSAGENSVGTRIELDHLGPTPAGADITVVARVTAVERRKVAFDVSVHDRIEVVATGKHVRFVLDLARQRQRLEAKAARLQDV